MKRLLFLIHRWGGVALALFMALWFITGLVIVYATQLNQNRLQQLAHAEALQPESGWLSLGEAWQRGKPRGAGIVEARLVRQGGEPLWLVEDVAGKRFALSAIDGRLRESSPTEAQKVAENWVRAGGEAVPVRYVETMEKPVIVRNLDSLRPFHRFAVDDGAGSELYVSAKSGEVVHASTRIERGMYWAGNWLHLFRFLDLTDYGKARTDVLFWTVLAALAATLTGLIVGWLRWRPGWFGKPTYAEGRTQPYRAFWFKWHFWSGLLGGLLALGWALSGFFNANPWQWFSPANPGKEEWVRYYGAGLPAAMRDWKPAPLAGEAPEAAPPAVVELSWRRLGEQAVLLAYERDGKRRVVQNGIGDAALLAAVHRLAGAPHAATTTQQYEYDSYYYPRHGRGLADRPLPVLRVDLGDPGATRFYLDPQDGRLLLRQDDSRRVYRWLFNGLHYWDFGWLHQRPLWDAWMLFWVGLGLVLSVSSAVLGWRRLRHTFRAKKRAERPADVLQPYADRNRHPSWRLHSSPSPSRGGPGWGWGSDAPRSEPHPPPGLPLERGGELSG